MTAEGVLVGLLLTVSGAGLCWIAWLGSQRRLPRNYWVGIRLPSTMADDESWALAHEEAAGALGIAGGIAATGGVGVLAVGLDDVVGTIVAGITMVGLLVSIVISAVLGSRAARSPR